MNYQRKVCLVQAWQFNPKADDLPPDWLVGQMFQYGGTMDSAAGSLVVRDVQGVPLALQPGDWAILSNGALSKLPDAEFQENYETSAEEK
jgi:hypothetical protein